MVNSRSYKTAKGTELPLLNLRGKEYLEVKYRLVWFREDHPDWSIETELNAVTDVSAYAKASVRDETGRVIATSHKFENIKGFPDFIEKAETGAIGRALALIGYGTQFCADELDEGKRIVDAPAEPVRANAKPASNFIKKDEKRSPVKEAKAPIAETTTDVKAEDSAEEEETSETEEISASMDPGDYRINFGRKYKGKKLKEIPKSEMKSYIQWLESSAVRPGTTLSHQLQFLKNAYERMYSPKQAEAASH